MTKLNEHIEKLEGCLEYIAECELFGQRPEIKPEFVVVILQDICKAVEQQGKDIEELKELTDYPIATDNRFKPTIALLKKENQDGCGDYADSEGSR